MSTIFTALCWCVLQTTLIAIVTLVVAICAGCFDRRLARTALTIGLGAMLVITTLAASPWPNWQWAKAWESFATTSLVSQNALATTTAEPTSGDAKGPSDVSRRFDQGSHFDETGDRARKDKGLSNSNDATRYSVLPETRTVKTPLAMPPKHSVGTHEADREPIGTPDSSLAAKTNESRFAKFFVALALGLVVWGVVRWVGGIVALGGLLRASRPLVNQMLENELSELTQCFLIRKSIRLYENSRLSTAATIGGLRPTILLPSCWREWNAQERQAILAHELAHIKQHDFLWGLWTQLCLAVNFYHPLAHWLTWRLRLEMEYQADAAAASIVGSHESYLMTLAKVAKRQNGEQLIWAVRSFLPTQSAFVRRVDMLRRSPFQWHHAIFKLQVCLGALMLMTFLVVIGIRGSQLTSHVNSRANSATVQKDSPFSGKTARPVEDDLWRFVPEETKFVVSVRLDMFRDSNLAADIARSLTGRVATANLEQVVGISIPDVSRWTMVSTFPDRSMREIRFGGILLLSFDKESPLQAIVENCRRQELEVIEVSGKECFSGEYGMWTICQLDSQTICVADYLSLQAVLDSNKLTESDLQSRYWSNATSGQWAFYSKTNLLAWSFSEPFKSAVSPYWLDCRAFIASVSLAEETETEIVAFCHDLDSAKRVRETSDAFAILAKAYIQQMPDKMDVLGGERYARMTRISECVNQLLSTRSFAINEDDATLLVKMRTNELEEADISELFAHETVLATLDQIDEKDTEKLKRIGIALINYHDTFGHFPPAVIRRTLASGQVVEHSWRVAILPFLGASELYRQYNFDERWDSEENLRVLRSDFDGYRSSTSQSGPESTSFFAVSGKGTVFDGENGIKALEVTDGVANTIAVVQLDRKVPWTLPQDYEWNSEKIIDDLGLNDRPGFFAAFADGAVRYIKKDIDARRLNAYMSRSGRDNPSR